MKLQLGDFKFDWDPEKAEANLKKHKVSFEEAATVFIGEDAQYYSDTEHSDDEERFIIIGYSANRRLLLVCHCVREEDSLIRIISARETEKRDAEHYKGGV